MTTNEEEFKISRNNVLGFSSAHAVLFWRNSSLLQRADGRASPSGWESLYPSTLHDHPARKGSLQSARKRAPEVEVWTPAFLQPQLCAWERPPKPLMPVPVPARDLGARGDALLSYRVWTPIPYGGQTCGEVFSTAGQTTLSRNKLFLALGNSFLKKYNLTTIDEACYVRKIAQ